MIVEAIKLINPDAVFEVGHNSIDEITWLEGTVPIDKSTIEAKIVEVQADYDSKQYQRDRQYPELGEQFDLLFKDINEGTLDKTGGFYTAIKSVKDAHPKPSE